MCQLPTQEIKTRDGQTVLVDGDYDGEYLSTHFSWSVVNGYVYGYQIGSSRSVKQTARTWGNNISLGRLVGMASGRNQYVTYRNGNHLDCRSCNVQVMTPREVMAKRDAKYDHTGGRYKRRRTDESNLH